MSTRLCAYKDCHNFYYRQDNSGCGDVTLFAFPKDTKRAEQWRVLGQVHPKIGPKQLYMCSIHFDAKYLSLNKNRRILLGEALPFPYSERRTPEENPEQMTATSSSTAQQSYCINPGAKKNQMEDDNLKESISTTCSSSQQSFYINMDEDDLSIDKLVMVESTTTPSQTKGNAETDLFDKIELSIVPPARKRARPPTLELDEEEPAAEDDQLIDDSEVSIFKFKGEQYVQMSREYYLQEKRQLLEQLRTYKRTLANIKMELMPLKDI
ncbi:uncharacterized protein Dlip2 [Drosophila virilis]|nr:uncharacterized protein LOC6629378 [Drosophila virilis]XP_032293299.1 uncharacterized protein LOC6629378 [Drosophila virilis]